MICGTCKAEAPFNGLSGLLFKHLRPDGTQCSAGAPLGRKDDAEKLRWDLLPESLEDVVKVLTFGAKKYSPDGWKQVPEARSRYFAAALRHLWAWHRGEAVDAESGLPHLAHAACCVLFLGNLTKDAQ